MLDFDYYLKKELVRKRSVDKSLARSLIKSSKNRMEFAIKIRKSEPKYALENAYEAIIELVDAILALKGYKSWSHEADIAFLASLKNFSGTELEKLDKTRKKRHSSKYYGISFEKNEVEEEIDFLRKMDAKLRKDVLGLF